MKLLLEYFPPDKITASALAIAIFAGIGILMMIGYAIGFWAGWNRRDENYRRP